MRAKAVQFQALLQIVKNSNYLFIFYKNIPQGELHSVAQLVSNVCFLNVAWCRAPRWPADCLSMRCVRSSSDLSIPKPQLKPSR